MVIMGALSANDTSTERETKRACSFWFDRGGPNNFQEGKERLTNTPPPRMMDDRGSTASSPPSPSMLVSGLALLLPPLRAEERSNSVNSDAGEGRAEVEVEAELGGQHGA